MERHVTWTNKLVKNCLFGFVVIETLPLCWNILETHFFIVVVVAAARGSWLVASDCCEANNMSIINPCDVYEFCDDTIKMAIIHKKI